MACQNYYQDVLILGCGKTGIDLARYCVNHPETVGMVTLYAGMAKPADNQLEILNSFGFKVVWGTEVVEGAFDLCIASPGISCFSTFFQNAQACSKEVVSEPEFAYRLRPHKWMAITGTNGKTTTTKLVTHILNSCNIPAVAVGNIGISCISVLDTVNPDTWLVAELSSFQLASAQAFHPSCATILNITPDHIAWHKTHEHYASSKLKLLQNLIQGDRLVVSPHSAIPAVECARLEALGVDVDLVDAQPSDRAREYNQLSAFVKENSIWVTVGKRHIELLSIDEIALKGAHNLENVLVSIEFARFAGAELEDIVRALKSFTPLAHRVEPCGEVNGVRFFNDSKATNCDATLKAITSFNPSQSILLVGGFDKGIDFAELIEGVSTCKAVVCFGQAKDRMLEAFNACEQPISSRVLSAKDLREAFNKASSCACPGDSVLLSPACSSFDEFSSYTERGDVFKALVKQLELNSQSK